MNGVQVRNLYVVKNLLTEGSVSNPGDLLIKAFGPATKNALSGKSGIQLVYCNVDGKTIVSDFIVKDQVISIDAVSGVGTPLKKAVLQLAGDIVAGEDYIVDIIVHNYQTISDNSQLTKYGAVHATANMSSQKFMYTLAKSFAMNFRRDEHINKFFTFWVGKPGTAASFKEVKFDTSWSAYLTASTTTEDTSNEYAVEVREVEQPTWYRGTYPKQTVNFDLAPHTVYDNGDEVQPFVVEETGLVAKVDTATVIPNGYAMADLEYLCHGEIGDQIREANYPRNIRTKYMVTDDDVTKMFDAVEIVFYYVGRNTSAQKAEKQITLAVDHALASTIAVGDLKDAVVAALEPTLAGLAERVTTLENA